jgi:acyl transferase domain-containing protein
VSRNDSSRAAGPTELASHALQRLQTRLAQLEARAASPIAIVGMACRLPGGIRDTESYWSLLRRGGDAITPIPPERWDVDAYFDPDPAARGRMYVRHGGFVEDIDRFDAALFDVSPRQAAQLDPQQRMLLEESWAALEDSGDLSARLAGSRTGVFVGIATNDYARRHLTSADPTRVDMHSLTGAASCIASRRIAYAFGLEGPAITVDTAGSSSLVAVHLACQSLRDGSCDLAIVGGVNALLDPALTIYLSRARALSPTGRCRAFDAGADGYVRSEGCAVVVLRRLEEAMARGDRVRAVIRGSAVNNDGRSNGLTAPNGAAQRRLLTDALLNARVEADEIGYVEAHSAGTPLGDPIEFGAIAAVFGGRAAPVPPLAIGSVKTNLGHLEAAAGLVGLIKLALCIERGTIPPQLHLERRNPHLGHDEARIVIPTSEMRWPEGHARRIGGVSAFGFGGTNVHVILDEPPARPPIAARGGGPALLTLSARSEAALRQLAARHVARLTADETLELADLCHSANTGRLPLGVRAALVASTREELICALGEVAAGEPIVSAAAARPRIGFLFSGQGASDHGMARALFAASPVFAATMERLDRTLVALGEPSLLHAIACHDALAGHGSARHAQPALFALQAALVDVWRAWGITPSAVIGHSLGEYAAAYAAGIWTAEEALALVVERARLLDKLTAAGSMWTVQLDERQLAAQLHAHPDVAVAAHNGPDGFVVSGADTAVLPLVEALRGEGTRVRQLEVTHALHSPVMDPLLDRFARAAERPRYRPARIAIHSTLLGRAAEPEELASPRYWRDHLRQRVQFDAAVRSACAQGIDAFVEIGPERILTTWARRIAGDEGRLWLAPMEPRRGGLAPLLESLGALFERGADFDAERLARERGPFNRVALPTYPFERRRYWMESTNPVRAAEPVRAWFELRRIESPAVTGALFTTELALEEMPLVADHLVGGSALVNLVVYLTLMTEAFAVATAERCEQLEDVFIAHPLFLRDGERHELQILVDVRGDGADLRVLSRRVDAPAGASWTLHARGLGRAGTVAAAATRQAARDVRSQVHAVDLGSFYDMLARRGIQLGPACRGLETISLDGDVAVGVLRDAGTPRAGEPAAMPLALVDGAFQATMLPHLVDEIPRIIVGFHRLRLTRGWREARYVRGEQRLDGDGGATARFELTDASGALVAVCEGIRFQALGSHEEAKESRSR